MPTLDLVTRLIDAEPCAFQGRVREALRLDDAAADELLPLRPAGIAEAEVPVSDLTEHGFFHQLVGDAHGAFEFGHCKNPA